MEKQIERAKILFGEDICTDENTVFGKYIRLNVYDYAQIYEDLEFLYYARFPNTASGTTLDRLCPFVGISRNPATYAKHKIKLIGTPGAKKEMGYCVSYQNILFHTLDDSIISEDGTVEALVECNETGYIGNVPNINQIENPDTEIEKIEYLSCLELGKERESDADLRVRFKQAVKGIGSGTADSIIGAVSRVPNVEAVNVVENELDITDAEGRPPHTFETYVLAPESQDNVVAEAIFSKKPLGIKSIGNVAVEVYDKGGLPHWIHFSRSKEILLFLKVTIRKNVFFETDGEEQMKENLSSFIFAHKNGENVILSSLYGHIYEVAGVKEVINLEISTDFEKTYTKENVFCTPFEVARLPTMNIKIEVEDYE